jgi:hypothetical protein
MKQSSEFRSLDACERAATAGALVRCRSIADRIAQELGTTKPEHLNKESLADFWPRLSEPSRILAHTRHR